MAITAHVRKHRRRYWAEVYDGAGDATMLVWCEGPFSRHADAEASAINAADIRLAKAKGHDVRNVSELIALRLASPIRPLDRTSSPVDGLALFDAVRSPCMI
jgi:hypothetical protein